MKDTRVLQLKFILIAFIAVLFVLIVIGVSINVGYRAYNDNNNKSLLTYLTENNGTIFADGGDGTDADREAYYRMRYFYLMTDQHGRFMYTNVANVSSVTDGAALAYAQNLPSQPGATGRVDNFYYSVSQKNYGLLYMFLDYSETVVAENTLLNLSIIMSLALLGIVAFVLVLLSWRVVRPFEASIEQQKRFITDATHEIKTPLAIIAANAGVLALENGDCAWTESIQNQTVRLTHLVDQMIMLTKFRESDYAAVKVDFCLSDAVLDVVTSFQTVAEERKTHLVYDVEEGITYYGDELRIRQLISLLMDNAVKYSDGEICLKMTGNHSRIALSLYNNCAEMTKETTKRMFDRFYRADDSRARSLGGNGIGLSVAKAIVENHGGKIYAETTDAHSVTVNVRLPV